ncbi:tetraacyldisaccharide 4'-kinase [Consotaella aegiceratis]|uniref:tetraacyldisaccharide 4'-kinase n=1 Tax=Consotaella aegiceratis TaxID=3097961 RepID=UPI002F3F1BCC
MKAPPFWWHPFGWQASLLAPIAWSYGAVARRRLDNGRRAHVAAPVICVGNPTLGGSGKTPTVLALGRAAKRLGLQPGFLSRGYGGSLEAPTLVSRTRHRADEVGDEPLMLADAGPAAIAVDRKAGAELLCGQAGVDLIIMDDGFQSARLATDYALLVIDGMRGLGNGAVFPAGPLRAPLDAQLAHADALLLVGEGRAGEPVARIAADHGKPLIRAAMHPRDPDRFRGRRVLAFAGIGDPDKFYRSLRAAGADLVETLDFPDHHRLSDDDMRALIAASERHGLQLVTTTKDAARLHGETGRAQALADRLETFDVDLIFHPEAAADEIVRAALATFERRRG